MLDGKTILVTGGTGSFGRNFIKYIYDNYNPKKIIIFSRDENKQFRIAQSFPDHKGILRFFIGDVRDLPRLERAFNGVDIVVHAAALKQIPILEYNPFEAVKTNIMGSQNVIDAAINQGVERVVLISTDKACQPVNLYGSTKLCAEKLFIDGNSYSAGKTKFSCVRYGNVLGSRGSIVETLVKNKNPKEVNITDERMTRFWITLDQSFRLVLFALSDMVGGELFIPKIPSMKLVDLFDALAPDISRKTIGIRPGEKLHEMLISQEEARHAVELAKYFVILPENSEIFDQLLYQKYFNTGKKLADDFYYSSDINNQWLTQNDLKKMFNIHN